MAPLELCSEQLAQPFTVVQLSRSLSSIENFTYSKKNECFNNTLNQKSEVYISKQFATKLQRKTILVSNEYLWGFNLTKCCADYET